jgi:hypothetical protein
MRKELLRLPIAFSFASGVNQMFNMAAHAWLLVKDSIPSVVCRWCLCAHFGVLYEMFGDA